MAAAEFGWPMIQTSLLFLAISALLACAGAFAAGHLTPMISTFSFLAAAVICVFAGKRKIAKMRREPLSVWIKLMYLVIGFGIYSHSMYLFYLKEDGHFWIQNVSNLGDLSFHWNVIRNLAKGASFWPENPIFLAHRFRYPFGMDLINAMFESLGVAIQTHLPLITMFTLFLTMASLHLAGGPLLVFAVFFSSGFYDFVSPKIWNVVQLQENLDFKNLFLTVLITQRGVVYALPAGLLLYHQLSNFFKSTVKPDAFEKVSLGIIWGALGIFHLHSYFIVSVYLGVLILWHGSLRTWALTIVLAIALGIPFVIGALLPDTDTVSLIHWSRGWARPENVNYFFYWFKNLGPWLIAMAVSMSVFYRRRDWKCLFPTALAFILFALFAHLILAPWQWDNIKLLIWCYIFGLLAIRELLWEKRAPWFRAFVFLLFCWPGLVLFVYSLPQYTRGASWVSERELNKATVLMRGRDVNAGLLINPTYDHPALLLGYKLYMGYPGHVWSHGYNYTGRDALLTSYFMGDKAGTLRLPKGQVGLVYRGPLEKRREKEGYTTKGLSKVAEALDHELYLVNEN